MRRIAQWTLATLLLAMFIACRGEDAPIEDMPLGTSTEAETLSGYFVDGPGVASPAPHRYDVYVTYYGILYHKRFSGGRWSGWTMIGSGVSSKPAAVSWGPGRVDLVARGTDGSVLHWWGDGDTFAGPESLGGSILYAPAIASRGAGQLQIFAVGTDHQLFVRSFGALGWSPGWSPLGGWINASPGAVSMDDSSTDVFVRGGDNALWHRWQRGGTWYGYESLGGSLTSGPAAASFNPGRLEVYGRNLAGGLSARTWSAVGWEDWKSVPVDGGVTSDPAAIRAIGETCDQLFFRQSDGSLGHRGCGDTTVAILGAFMSSQGSFETTVFSGDALAPYQPILQETLEGMWPRELVLLDTFDSESCSGASCWFPPVVLGPPSRHYSTLPGWQHVFSGGFDLSADFGPFKASTSAPYSVRQARLVDHGACSIKTRWTNSVYDYPANDYYPDPAGVGVLSGFFAEVYDGIDSGIRGTSTATTTSRTFFYMEPTFLTPPGSTDLRARDDGFALSFKYHIHTRTDWYLPDSDVDVSGAANYRMSLDAQGLLQASVVGAIAGSVDKDLVAAVAQMLGKPIKNSEDVRASLSVDLPNAIHQGFIDSLTTTGFCNASLDAAAQAAACVGASAPALKIQLRDAMLASGMSATAANATADEIASKLAPSNFACVADASGASLGLCKYHPAFKRVNVLPDGFELVVSESDDTSNNDVRILAYLSPSTYAACQNISRKPLVSGRPLYRLDGDVWMIP